jgi:hypothetical protein
MSFVHGKIARYYINGVDLSAYLSKLSVKAAAAASETTTLGKTSKTFIAGLKDATWSADGLFDGAVGAVDAVMQPLLGADAQALVTEYPAGDVAIGDRGRSFRSRSTEHSVDAPVDGLVATALAGQVDDDLESCVSLHPLGDETGAGAEASLDNAASSAAGSTGYLHVTAITGTNVVVLVEHSTNDVAWVTLLTFTSATVAGTSQRVTSAGTVNRYVRVSCSGTFTSATFAVAFSRK